MCNKIYKTLKYLILLFVFVFLKFTGLQISPGLALHWISMADVSNGRRDFKVCDWPFETGCRMTNHKFYNLPDQVGLLSLGLNGH